ncbi:MAG TPA: FkbM family methyltransferase [Opitutaceae bacterium]|jgi:FkbM family methyltransferase|nr:FkbM family methyltransferase [Opitutaceae bacterium]
MSAALTGFVRRWLARSPIGRWPVRVRGGVAEGAKWTLFPWTSYWRGGHEPDLQACLLGLGDLRGWSCWDVGAHLGLYSVGLALRVGPSGQVAAFEPNSDSFARLEHHRRLNRLDWLKTYPCAASDRDGSGQLLTADSWDSTTTHLPYLGEDPAAAVGSRIVPVRSLDGLVAAGEIRLPQLVKIDAEGHGAAVLRGMAASLRAARPRVIMGFHDRSEVEAAAAILEPLGYGRVPIGPPASDPDEMIGMDFLFTPRPGR